MVKVSDTSRIPIDTSINGEDYLLGTDTDNNLKTKSFKIKDLITFVAAHISGGGNILDESLRNTINGIKTEIEALKVILQSDDTDLDELQEIVNYIKQNKHILSVLSIDNIAGLEEALNNKANVNHTHSYNDLTDKPTNFLEKGDYSGTAKDLSDAIDTKVDKEEGKSLSTNDFTNYYKQKLDSLQNVDISGKLDKGTYTGNAKDLENLINTKVTQEPGKGLISDAEKTDIAENKKKRVVDFTITGDVNKVFTLIYNDSTTKQKNFTDIVGQSGADVMLNSLNFNKDTGVLTGVRSDGQQITVDLNGRWALLNHTHQDLVAKTEIEKVIDVTTVDSTGNFKSGSGSIIPHISNDGVFSINAGEIGSGDLIIEIKKSGVTIPKYLHVRHIRAEKLRISKSGSTWLDMDSRNNELNVFSPSNENVYVPIKASGYKTPNGNKGKVFASDGSQLLFTKGVDVSTHTYQPNNNHIESGTIFLTGNGDKTINLHELENHTVLSFKKCYDGGTITFVCNGKTLVIRGADAFNGADGSNAVISIVDNKCYVDINNYE